MKIKARNSLWIVLVMAVVIILQAGAVAALHSDAQDLRDQVAQKSMENWSQKTTSDADLAACQDAVTGALEAVHGSLGSPSEYTVESAAQDCLRR